MKKFGSVILIMCCLFLYGCTKEKNNEKIDELSKNNIEEILLKDIKIESDSYLYAIGINNEKEEVFIKYRYINDEMSIIDVSKSNLNFSYRDLINTIKKIDKLEFKNALLAIINNSERIEIVNNSEIKEVLKIDGTKEFSGIVAYYKINKDLHKFIFTYDLGDYYIADETSKEIHYPIYCKYNQFK